MTNDNVWTTIRAGLPQSAALMTREEERILSQTAGDMADALARVLERAVDVELHPDVHRAVAAVLRSEPSRRVHDVLRPGMGIEIRNACSRKATWVAASRRTRRVAGERSRRLSCK